jgi:hypothetical protein
MVRQAHTYLVGAMSGATLIAIAIAVFVVLVSAQVFKDWPLAALGGGDETAAVSKAHPAGGSAAGAAAGAAAIVAAAGKTAPAAGEPAGGAAGSRGSVAGGDGIASGGGQITTTAPGESAPGSGQSDGSGSAASPQSPGSTSPSGSSSSGGGSTGSGSSGGGGGGATGGGGSTSGTASTPSAQVTETVNGTVAKVDETALGGTLHEAGVSEVTESVVNGVAGPESTVGKVVDETVGAVGGLLGGKR